MAKGVAVAGLIFGIFGLSCSVISSYLPHWNDYGSSLYNGLWKFDYGIAHGNWPNDVPIFDSTDRLHGYIVRYAMVGGAVLMLLSMFFILGFICGQGKRALAACAGILCVMSVAAHAAAVVFFSIKFEVESGQEYDIGYYLAIASGAFGLLASICKIIAALRSGNKIEHIQPALNSDRSNRSYRGNQNVKNNRQNKNANKNEQGGRGRRR